MAKAQDKTKIKISQSLST